MRVAKLGVFLMMWLCILGSSWTIAAESEKFKGRIGIGFVAVASRSEAYIDDLDSPPGRKFKIIPLIIPNISYDPGRRDGLKLYLNADPPLGEAGDYVLAAGVRYGFQTIGSLDIGAFFNPFEKTWKNPYLTGMDRQDTDVRKYGVKAAFRRIMGSGLNVRLVYLDEDVADDDIGRLQPDLGRDGRIAALDVSYSVYLTKRCELRPLFGFRRGDFEGRSKSFDKFKTGLETRFAVNRAMLLAEVFYTRTDYDKVDPVFNQTRSNEGYGISLKASYLKPFGWNDWSVQALVDYCQGVGNIAFYNTETVNMGAFFSYHF